MSALFRRSVRLTVAPRPADTTGELAAGFDFSNLDCTFSVRKNLKEGEPNTCDLRIFNMAAESRATLQTSERVIVRLEAGYGDELCQLYRGELRRATTTHTGSDVITQIESGDSEKEILTSLMNLSVGKNVPANVVLMHLVAALKVGQGNAPQFAERLSRMDSVPYGKGTLIFGSAAESMTEFCDSFGLSWSIQDGAILLLEKGKSLDTTAVLLSSETGLIGSPTIDHKGIAKAKALIQPGLDPGFRVKVESPSFEGLFRIEEAEYTGDTAGEAWFVEITGKASK